jgi:methyltransferase (TIGR00027 family)
MDPLGQTSQWMAAVRSCENERPDRLFEDPLAEAFADSEGFGWMSRMEFAQLWGGPGLYIVIRTRFFDDFLIHSSWSAEVRQIVLLAAGMDARAFRLEWPPNTRLYELDRPEVLNAKEDIVARSGLQATCERHVIRTDLGRSSWRQALLDADYTPEEPAVWLVEGLLFYMDEATIHSLLEGIAALSASHSSWLGADLMNRDLLVSPMMWPLLATFAGYGVPGRFGTNDPETLFAKHGWKVQAIQAGEHEANYGRWPYPVVPREVAGIPRIFLVRAQQL